MAYKMKSSPAKLVGALKGLKAGFKIAKKIIKRTTPKPNKYNPITDPNKAKKTAISDNYNMRTDYSNEFIKSGSLKNK